MFGYGQHVYSSQNVTNEDIYGWFEKDKDKGMFKGVYWGTLAQLRAYGKIKKTMVMSFRMGTFILTTSTNACLS